MYMYMYIYIDGMIDKSLCIEIHNTYHILQGLIQLHLIWVLRTEK